MVRASRVLLQQAGSSSSSISKALSDFLVCPLSKKPLRYCEDSQSLISDATGVSFPIVDGIPCLAPKDGRILSDQGCLKSADGDDPAIAKSERGDPH